MSGSQMSATPPRVRRDVAEFSEAPFSGFWAATRAYVLVAVEHANSEVVGIHAARSANRFEALEPVRQGVHRCFGFDRT